jgi:predicted transcriptional regulator
LHVGRNTWSNAVSEATFTFRVDDALKEEFSAAAKTRDRTGAQLLRDFMRDYVKQQQDAAEYDAWLQAKVSRSKASADAGELVPDAEVEAVFAARRAATRRRLQTSK